MAHYDERVPGADAARFVCWLGAIVDLLAGIQLLLPSSVHILSFRGLRAPGVAGAPAVTAAILMFGFTLILLWAQARVVKRRAVLLITLAVVVSLALANVVNGIAGALSWEELFGPLLIQAALIALFGTSYASLARRQTLFKQRGRLQKMG